MIELFKNYCKSEKKQQALLVGQNIVNRNPGNKEAFELYFDYLLLLAKNSVDNNNNANLFLEQATGVLSYFSENTVLNDSMVDYIIKKQEELDRISEMAYSVAQYQVELQEKNIKVNNAKALRLLNEILNEIVQCKEEKDFKKYIDELRKIDQCINRNYLNEEQENRYTKLTTRSSEIVSSKLAYFHKIKDREYNIQAVEAYEKIFNMFKNGNVDDNHKKVMKELFVFDTSRLYNETLVYYNHVYNYILGKLNDEEKFIMTKYAIMCEKEVVR